MQWIEIVKTAGSIASAFLGVVAVLTMLLKPVRQKVVDAVSRAARTSETSSEVAELRELVERQNTELYEAVTAIREENKVQTEKLNSLQIAIDNEREASKASLGNTIKHIYFKYKDDRKLPVREVEALCLLHNAYKLENGNSFVDSLFDEMMNEWEHVG